MREPTFTNAICKAESKQISKDFAYCEDALGRAENAIGNLPSVQPEKHTEKRAETHACDLIDRQAAIDALHMHLMYRMGTDSNKKRLDEWINNLPSAQPTQEIIHCKDCRFWKKYKYFNGKPTYAPFCGFNSIFTDDNDFCSRAEKRGEG